MERTGVPKCSCEAKLGHLPGFLTFEQLHMREINSPILQATVSVRVQSGKQKHKKILCVVRDFFFFLQRFDLKQLWEIVKQSP